jgi:biopolymer transport protein ExbB/TolQ
MDGLTIVKFFQEGGAFMYPILIVMALGVAIAIERYIYLTLAKTNNTRMWDQLMPLVKNGDYQQAVNITQKAKADIGRILAYGLSRLKGARRREDIETAMEEGLMEIVPRLEKRTHYIATFANIATLLGLLGTVIGLIQAFTAVANANPAEKADLLSGSISVAMNTTAFGLIVAIPLMLIYAVLQTKTTELVDSLEMASVKFINMIMERATMSGTH